MNHKCFSSSEFPKVGARPSRVTRDLDGSYVDVRIANGLDLQRTTFGSRRSQSANVHGICGCLHGRGYHVSIKSAKIGGQQLFQCLVFITVGR